MYDNRSDIEGGYNYDPISIRRPFDYDSMSTDNRTAAVES